MHTHLNCVTSKLSLYIKQKMWRISEYPKYKYRETEIDRERNSFKHTCRLSK